MTLRALRVLEQADSIACEDTRETQKLLNHFGIKRPMVSYHAHNEMERSASLIAELKQGKRIAVVTDAGMPGISDPGVLLAQAAVAAGIRVTPIPGANAAITALVASGLSTGFFTFCGFLPSKAGPSDELVIGADGCSRRSSDAGVLRSAASHPRNVE